MAASGTPPWSAATGIGFMGASETLRDYLDLGPPNVLDSVTAQQYARLAQAAAWLSSTAAMLVGSVTGQETATTEPTVEAYSMTYGYGSYVGDAPTGDFPTVSEVSSGRYRITFAASFSDESGASGGYSLTVAATAAEEATNDTYSTVTRVNAVAADVYNLDWSAGTAVIDTTAFVEIC